MIAQIENESKNHTIKISLIVTLCILSVMTTSVQAQKKEASAMHSVRATAAYHR